MLKLTALGVGHGDATLLQWFEDGDPNKPGFTCLVDGGESPSKLIPALDRHGVTEINLLVLTHFDADHIGGLEGIWDHCKIHTYWAPCLAAFERHMWIFGTRIQSGLAHARHVEDSLRAHGVQVSYPLDRYSSSPLQTGDLTLHVLSPAARVIRTLLLDRDVEWLFTQTPMPLGWLAGSTAWVHDHAEPLTPSDAVDAAWQVEAPSALPGAGDDLKAKAKVMQLLDNLGLDAVDGGGLDES